jgi:hypothetical protein
MLRVPCLGILRKALGSMLPYAAVTARSGCRAAKASKKGACGPGAVPTVDRVWGSSSRLQCAGKVQPVNHLLSEYAVSIATSRQAC